MSEIHYPEGPGTPVVARPAAPRPAPRPARPGHAEPEPEAPQDSPWQAAVIRVSTIVAVWLGY